MTTFAEELAARLRHACTAAKASTAAIALSRNSARFSVSSGSTEKRGFSTQNPTLIGCLAKPLTAVLLSQLIARDERHTLGSSVGPLLDISSPAAKELLGDTTLAQLLNHSHGLEDPLREDVPRDSQGFVDCAALLDELVASGRLFSPGRTYSYGNAGYWLSGAFIERMTGQRLQEVMMTELLQPLSIASNLDRGHFCPSFGGDAMLSADGLLTLAQAQLGRARWFQELLDRSVTYPGWISTSRASPCGWVNYGDGWYGQNAILKNHSAVIRFSPEKQIALAVTSHTPRAFHVMAAVFGDVLPEMTRGIDKPRPLTQAEIDAQDWSLYIGDYRSPAVRLTVRRSNRPHLPLQLMVKERNANPITIQLQPADGGVFFAVPGSRAFASIQFVSLEGEAMLLWNGTRVWRRV